MLVNLVPEFLAILAAPDPTAAYHEYLDRHKPVLQSYWHNYVLDPTSPHAEQVMAASLRAERADLERLLEDVDVATIAEDALLRSLERLRRTAPWTCISWWAWAPPTRASWWWADAGLPSFVSSISLAGRIPRRTAWDSRRTCCRSGSRTKWRTRCGTRRRRVAPT